MAIKSAKYKRTGRGEFIEADNLNVPGECTIITFTNEGGVTARVTEAKGTNAFKRLEPGETIIFGTENPDVEEYTIRKVTFEPGTQQKRVYVYREIIVPKDEFES